MFENQGLLALEEADLRLISREHDECPLEPVTLEEAVARRLTPRQLQGTVAVLEYRKAAARRAAAVREAVEATLRGQGEYRP